MDKISKQDNVTIIENDVIDDLRLSGSDMLVYLALSYHAHQNNSCSPPIRQICQTARVSKPTALKTLRKLEKLGVLKRQRRENEDGGIISNLYILMPKGENT